MLAQLLQDISLFRVLHQIDKDLASAYRQAGCPFCNSPLHNAPYTRKPRGGPDGIPDEYCVRQSLCCSRVDCRRRVLPPSCLFWGRKVYWGAVILIVTTLWQQNPRKYSINMLAEKFKISRNSVVRWIRYFHDAFPKSSGWYRLRGLISAEVGNTNLPGALVEFFIQSQASSFRGLINCLKCFAFDHFI
jgi:hypothetical protein